MNLAINVKLKIAPEDAKLVFRTFKEWQYAWQTVADWSFNNKLSTSQMEAHTATYRQIRDKFPELAANLVQSARTDALAKIKTVKRNKQSIEKPPQLKKCILRYDTRTSKIKGNEISLSICGGSRIKASFEPFPRFTEFRAKYRLKSPMIFYRDGQFWATMNFEVPEPPVSEESPIIGIDLGQRNFVATSEGRLYHSKKLNRSRRKTNFLKRQLQRKGTKSARRKLKTLRGKETRQSRDAVCCTVKQLLRDTNASVFALEKLDLKPKKHQKDANRRQRAVPYGLFKTILDYKAAFHGKRVVCVNPWMTSQYDCRGLTKGKRENGRYLASDGKTLNSDINAACNIAIKAKLAFKLTNPVSAVYSVSDINWQAVVNRPIVCKSPEKSDVLQAHVFKRV